MADTLRCGVYLFVPFKKSITYYAIICERRTSIGRYSARFFMMNGSLINTKILIPISIASEYGKFYPLVYGVNVIDIRSMNNKF